MINHPEKSFEGSEPEKKRKKKKLTGIIKDLKKIRRFYLDHYGREVYLKNAPYIYWSDVEAIIKKYTNP